MSGVWLLASAWAPWFVGLGAGCLYLVVVVLIERGCRALVVKPAAEEMEACTTEPELVDTLAESAEEEKEGNEDQHDNNAPAAAPAGKTCGAPCTSGKPCKRKVATAGERCYQHRPAEKKKDSPAEERVPAHLAPLVNTRKAYRCRTAQQSLKRLLKRGPRASDGPGWVYAYSLPQDGPEDDYIKLGCTERAPDQRIKKEWKGTPVGAWKVPHRRWAERILHVFFDDLRVYRVPFGPDKRCILSRWKSANGAHAAGQLIEDSHTALLRLGDPDEDALWVPRPLFLEIRRAVDSDTNEPIPVRPRFGRHAKEVEWFRLTEREARRWCRAVVAAILGK